MIPLFLSVAGGMGALARFVVDGLVRTKLGRLFPWGTMVINVSGSFVLGLLTGLVLSHHLSPQIKLIAGTGFCGGYTTFSTASFETVRLLEEKRLLAALFNVGGGLALSLIVAALGIWLGQKL